MCRLSPPWLISFNHTHCPCSINVSAMIFGMSSPSSPRTLVRLMFSCFHSYFFIYITNLRLSFHPQYFNCYHPPFLAEVPAIIIIQDIVWGCFQAGITMLIVLLPSPIMFRLLSPIFFTPIFSRTTRLYHPHRSGNLFDVFRSEMRSSILFRCRFYLHTIYDGQLPHLVYCYHPHCSVDTFSHDFRLITILIV